jgi:hypothetical protein
MCIRELYTTYIMEKTDITSTHCDLNDLSKMDLNPPPGECVELNIQQLNLSEPSKSQVKNTSSLLSLCEYVGRKGLCGKKCYGGRCAIHRSRPTMNYCLSGCARGTVSKTGYCAQCANHQKNIGAKMRKKEYNKESIEESIEQAKYTLQLQLSMLAQYNRNHSS